jgi:hypothetical protein
LRHFGIRPGLKKQRGRGTSRQSEHQECNSSGDRPHFREAQGRVEFVSKLLKSVEQRVSRAPTVELKALASVASFRPDLRIP